MPNWCSVSVSISGKKENVERMFREITALQQVKRTKSNVPYGFLSDTPDWLGYVVKDIFGLEPDSDDAPYCRGYFTDLFEDIEYSKDGKTAYWLFQYDHAWCPAYNFNIMLRKHYDVKVTWESEEPGMLAFSTNSPLDKPFFARFSNCDEEFFATEAERNKYILDFIHDEDNFPDIDTSHVQTLDKAIEFISDQEDSDYCFLDYGEYKFVDDSDYFLPMNQN